MKNYFNGFITSTCLTASLFLFVGSQNVKTHSGPIVITSEKGTTKIGGGFIEIDAPSGKKIFDVIVGDGNHGELTVYNKNGKSISKVSAYGDGDGEVQFDLDAALGSNNEWYHITPLHIKEWDGNSNYFNIQFSSNANERNYGDFNVMKQSSYSAPQIQNPNGSAGGIYSYSSSNQHSIKVQCSGRSSTIKLLLRVTSDWS